MSFTVSDFITDISTAEHSSQFGSFISFLLELLVITLCSSPIAYWIPYDLRASFASAMSFCLFILSIGFSRQEYWREVATCLSSGSGFVSSIHYDLSWVVLHGVSLSFIKLHKPLPHDKPVIHEGDKKCRQCLTPNISGVGWYTRYLLLYDKLSHNLAA